ncbi:MAG TPA: CAP domain-containing protein, partial [Desulfosarcina sp.]|nr:CAP domain-containing protein [Desulfosarcina sp.]
MNRALVASCLCLLLVGALQAVNAGTGFVTPYAGQLKVEPGSVNPDIVLRQRLVSIRLELLPRAVGQEVLIALFDDVVLRAVCDRVESNAAGGFAWIGHTPDAPGGVVTLAVAGQALSGAVEIPAAVYHIRRLDDAVHVVREIRPPDGRTARSLAAGAQSALEDEVVALVNLERQVANLHPLASDSALASAALGHSTDMAQQNYFSHDSLDGRKFYQRITAAGYTYSTCGENIAAGYSTPQAVMNGWMNSPGHRANILHSTFCDIGVGHAYRAGSTYGHYWTQDFGRRQGVSVCPTVVVEYTITATAAAHGTITPSGSVKVRSGAGQSFQMSPDAGYRILDVRVDGVSVGAVAAYTF